MEENKFYHDAKLESIQFRDASIGLREFGEGQDLLLIHGFPTHGYTWRKLLPRLSKEFKCHVVDLPGLGNSEWAAETEFSSTAQAHRLIQLCIERKIEKCTLVAHDSGATVARIMAIERPDLVEKLILINTEIPGHRPPWIPFYQRVGPLPLVPDLIRNMLKCKWFIKSPMGFREAYWDKSLFNNPENLGPYIEPLIQSKQKVIGAFKYLRGIDWKAIDEFEHTHKKIEAEILLIWGANDRTFPIALAENMIAQFNASCTLVRIKNASLLPHEEKSEEVVDLILNFLNNADSRWSGKMN